MVSESGEHWRALGAHVAKKASQGGLMHTARPRSQDPHHFLQKDVHATIHAFSKTYRLGFAAHEVCRRYQGRGSARHARPPGGIRWVCLGGHITKYRCMSGSNGRLIFRWFTRHAPGGPAGEGVP